MSTDVYMAQDMGAMVHADGIKFYEDTANGYENTALWRAETLVQNTIGKFKPLMI